MNDPKKNRCKQVDELFQAAWEMEHDRRPFCVAIMLLAGSLVIASLVIVACIT